MKKTLSLILCACLLALAAAGCKGGKPAPKIDINKPLETDSEGMIPFGEMEYEEYDGSNALRLAKEVAEASEAADGGKRLVELYGEAVVELNRMSQLQSLAYVYSYNDMSDEYWASRLEEDSVVFPETADKLCAALSDALKGKNGGALASALSLADEIGLYDYEPYNERTIELMAEEAALVNEYNTASAEVYFYSLGGRDWTLDDLNGELGNELGEYQYYEALIGIYGVKNAALAPIYQKLLKVRDGIAEANGYDSYADYAYDETYSRSYSPEDIEPFCKNVREYLAPLLLDMLMSADFNVFPEIEDYALGDMLDVCDGQLEKNMPALGGLVDYVKEYNLYTAEYKPTSYVGGFSLSLPVYRSSYLFIYPQSGDYTYTTSMHELGHFANTVYANPFDSLLDASCLDISEIQSTALENMMIDGFYDICSEADARAAARQHLLQSVYAIVSGCIVHEFEVYAYAHPDATVRQLNAAYDRIQSSYELGTIFAGADWSEIPHLFSSPMYYISYSTSGLASLGIQAQYEKDKDSARETYLTALMVEATDESFEDFCGRLGLWRFTDKKDVKAAAKYINSRMEGLAERAHAA